jgi:hypothetical protein
MIPEHDCHQSPDDGCKFCAEWYEMDEQEKARFLEEELLLDYQRDALRAFQAELDKLN